MPAATLQLEACQVDLSRRVVHAIGDGSVRELTTREADLLRFLASHPSRPVGRDELLAEVWGYADAVVSRACDNTVRRLRAKVEADPARPDHLITVHGTGYRFEPLATATPPPTPTPSAPRRRLHLGAITIDLGRNLAEGTRGQVALSALEVALLERLSRANGAVVSRATLLNELWGRSSGRALDTAVRRLRAKIEVNPSKPVVLITERREGYRLVLPQRVVPAQSSIVGRDALLQQVLAAIGTVQWVVLVGHGGIGKTRLARQIASLWPAPVWWADLATSTSVDAMLASVAEGLGVGHAGSDPDDQIARILARRGRGLLVLDNLEQLVDAAAPVVDRWRLAAPEVVMLGTSRIRLGLDDELAIEVPPLSVDDAVQLFLTRARMASRSFRVGPGGDNAVRALVSALDGVPLAVELAAARAPVLQPTQLLERIDQFPDLLVRPRASAVRHRSLRASIGGSWELLDSDEQRALLQLACFRGPFTIEDVEGTLGPDGLDLLQALRDHSLIHTHTESESFGVFAAIRDFVETQRRASSEDHAIECAYVTWMARLGTRAHLAALATAGPEAAQRQHDAAAELRAAAQLALVRGAHHLAARCALGAAWSGIQQGPHGRCLTLVSSLAPISDLDRTTRAELHICIARLLRVLDRPSDALVQARQAVALADGPLEVGEASEVGAYALRETFQHAEAQAWAARAAQAHALAEQPDVAAWCLARALSWGDGEEGPLLEALQECTAAARERGNERLMAGALRESASLDRSSGRLHLARQRLEVVGRVVRRYGLHPQVMFHLQQSMLVFVELDDHDAVEAAGTEALELCERMAWRIDEATVHAYLATSRLLRSDPMPCRSALDAGFAAARDAPRPIPRTVGYLERREAQWYLSQGDPASAEHVAGKAVERLADVGDSGEVAACSVQALALARLGRHTEATRLAEAALDAELRRGRVRATAVAHGMRGLVAIAAGEREHATAQLRAAEDAMPSTGSAPGGDAGFTLSELRTALES